MIAVGVLVFGVWASLAGAAWRWRRHAAELARVNLELLDSRSKVVDDALAQRARVVELEAALEEARRALACCAKSSMTEARAAARDALLTVEAVGR